MEIFEIYQVVLFFGLLFAKGAVSGRLLYGCVFIGLGIWLALFVLQGVGMYKMVKNRSLKNKWLAFVPFVNIWYMGKLAGTCNIFGRKMKRAGLYTVLAQILAVVVCAATVAAEIMLYTTYAGDMIQNESGSPQWPGLTGFAMYVRNYYYFSDFIVSIAQLAYTIMLFILLMGLYKKYYARGYLLISWLALLVPASRYVAVFVLRNNKAIDYDAYMRAKREEFMRRQQQNPYGNPYNRGPYNQGPYSQNPYGGNPYNQPPDGYGQNNNPPGGQKSAPDDPFSEFASGSSSGKNSSDKGNSADGTGGSNPSGTSGGSGGDDLFG